MMTMTLEGGRQITISHPGGGFRPFRGDRLVKVRLYGELAKAAGSELWELAVSSVRETINALHHLTRGATTKYIADHNKDVRWRVLVNDHQIDGSQPGVADELMIERDVESIDIFPVMEGAGGLGGILEAIVGAVLIVVGVILFETGFGGFLMFSGAEIEAGLVVAGIAAILGGLISLFSTPAKIKTPKTQNNPSYLFSGTVNTQDQGGPVPVAYGNVIIGSQTISAYVESSQVWAVFGSNVNFQLPSPFAFTPVGTRLGAKARDAVTGLATALTQYWQALGPDGFWGYCTGVTLLPTNPDVPVLQEPVGEYPNGPEWLVRMDNGSLGANYTPGGNWGPWETLHDAPCELDPIIATQATDTYFNWEPTPNLA